MINTIEVKIGEEIEVEHEGKKIKLIAKKYDSYAPCHICRLGKENINCSLYRCGSFSRDDGKNIYFEEVEK